MERIFLAVTVLALVLLIGSMTMLVNGPGNTLALMRPTPARAVETPSNLGWHSEDKLRWHSEEEKAVLGVAARR
jgi:hypothetical protein